MITTETASVTDLHAITLLVRNVPGVLVRIALIFSRRGYNIESLGVGLPDPKEHPVYRREVENLSTMHMTCKGDQESLTQIVKQLEKLIDVIEATEVTTAALPI